jgi:hypothetical protein
MNKFIPYAFYALLFLLAMSIAEDIVKLTIDVDKLYTRLKNKD